MERDRWARVETLVSGAMELPAPARRAWLHFECGDDTSLLAEATSLVEQLESDPGYLESPVVRHDVAAPALLSAGERVGAWTLRRLLGRGGMGEVYLATREVDGVAQEAALKIVRRGMDTDDVVHRFRLERRILSQLNHPGIAALLDAGVTNDGRPWFAMEYVDGAPLSSHCDGRRLPVRERLVLILRICDALEHAHQRLVVHRDLKPRNILVTPAGTPTLLDFGIGKVMDESGSFGSAVETRTDMRLLTPEYAAPEQVAGGYITTATDVHALGVILYELLTGAHPWVVPGMARSQLEHAVSNLTPVRPSDRVRGCGLDTAALRQEDPASLARRLSGDLDTIVLMALRKEPERRYPSAAALAADIRRHLDALPVSARPDTLGYRARKFVTRNRALVAATGIVAVALAGVMSNTVIQSRRVAAEAARTAAERDKALEVRGFLMEMFGATGAGQSVGDTVSVRALLDRQRSQLDVAYRGRDVVKADMLEVLADGYDRLGLYADAEPMAQRALELRRRLLPTGHPDLSASLNLMGWITHERGRSADAVPFLEDAIRIRRADSARAPGDLSRSLNDLGVVFNALRRYDEAKVVLREALALRLTIYGEAHRAVGITANNLAAAHYFSRSLDSAVAVQELALRSLQAAVGEDHQRTVVALSNLAAFRAAKGDRSGAIGVYRDLAARQTRLQGRDHPVTSRVLVALATLLAVEGTDTTRAESEALFREAHVALDLRLGPGHPQVAQALDQLGAVVASRGRLREGIELQERALAQARAHHADTSRVVREVARHLAATLRASGDSAGGDDVLRRVGVRN